MNTTLRRQVARSLADSFNRHQLPDQGLVEAIAAVFDDETTGGSTAELAMDRALKSAAGSLFPNRVVLRETFLRDVLSRLAKRDPDLHGLTEVLLRFATHAESQLARAMRKDRSEEFLRSNLQTWLARDGLSIREAHEGTGQVDLVLVEFGGVAHVIEAKVPDAQGKFDDGVTEVANYAITMRLREAFYVFVDHCPDYAAPRFQQAPHHVLERDGVTVQCVRILVPESTPSAVGRERRRRKRAT